MGSLIGVTSVFIFHFFFDFISFLFRIFPGSPAVVASNAVYRH